MSGVVWMWLSAWEKLSVVIKYFMTSFTWSVINFDTWRSLNTVSHVSRGLNSVSVIIAFLKHLYFRFEWVFLVNDRFIIWCVNCRAWVQSREASAVILGSQSSCAYPTLSLLPNSLQNCLQRGWHWHYIFLSTLSDSLLAPSLQVQYVTTMLWPLYWMAFHWRLNSQVKVIWQFSVKNGKVVLCDFCHCCWFVWKPVKNKSITHPACPPTFNISFSVTKIK